MKIVDKICQTLGFYSDVEELVEEDEPIEEIFNSQESEKNNANIVKNKPKIVNIQDKNGQNGQGSKIAALFSSNNKKNLKLMDVPLEENTKVTVFIVNAINFDDSQKIADHLNNQEAVVVKFDIDQTEINRRIIDFVSGTIYALGGSLKKVGDEILVCAPKNVTIDPNTMEPKINKNFTNKFNIGW